MVDEENTFMADNHALAMAGFDDVEDQVLEPFNPMLERHSSVAKPASVPHLRGQQQGAPPQALPQGGRHHHPRPLPQEAYNMTTWHTPNTHTKDR